MERQAKSFHCGRCDADSHAGVMRDHDKLSQFVVIGGCELSVAKINRDNGLICPIYFLQLRGIDVMKSSENHGQNFSDRATESRRGYFLAQARQFRNAEFGTKSLHFLAFFSAAISFIAFRYAAMTAGVQRSGTLPSSML